MHTREQAKESLLEIEWVDGKIVPVVEGPYRYRVMVHCSFLGRQKAMFSNGEHSYFCYVEVMTGSGQWIERGAGIVPVLPDGRLIMVVEQRPPQGRYLDRPMIAKIAGKSWDLNRFGPYTSLEFPGGGIDPGEGLKASFLRELGEETDIENQSALCYRRLHPTYPFGSDIACQQFLNVVFLSGFYFSKHVANDGGLTVIALTALDVQQNI